MTSSIKADQNFIWHPYTQHAIEREPLIITHAKEARLYADKDGEPFEILDMISSWWTCTHGHSHPELNRALQVQAENVPHVMFAGFSHEPAIKLAQNLARHMPEDLTRTFYSDNGSTAVEVALKMAYQFWTNKGEKQRTAFLAFDGAYHGDTFGAMSVSRGSGFFSLFEGLMCPVHTIPYAHTWHDDFAIEDKEQNALKALDQLLETNGTNIAAIILEPLMQGAAGFRFCRPEFIRKVVEHVKAYDILVVFDEVATGFGRTGTLFAFEQIGITPDMLCLSKGLTAGYMPLAITLTRQSIFETFLGDGFDKALAHGHTFTANPLACAVANKSLELFEQEQTLQKIKAIHEHHSSFLEDLKTNPHIEKCRVLGSVLACNLADQEGYKSKASLQLKDWYQAQGFNIRPLGSTLYLMPPYCISETELQRAYTAFLDGLAQCL
ncbi:MAG: adenosylmethionine--8-amino-7-oxononanoate transaminase [Pseudomonadota bacterium]